MPHKRRSSKKRSSSDPVKLTGDTPTPQVEPENTTMVQEMEELTTTPTVEEPVSEMGDSPQEEMEEPTRVEDDDEKFDEDDMNADGTEKLDIEDDTPEKLNSVPEDDLATDGDAHKGMHYYAHKTRDRTRAEMRRSRDGVKKVQQRTVDAKHRVTSHMRIKTMDEDGNESITVVEKMELKMTPLENVDEMVEDCRKSFRTHQSIDYEFRLTQLKQLYKLILNNESEIVEAVRRDFKKPFEEAKIAEIYCCRHEIVTAIKNLKTWMKGTRTGIPGLNRVDKHSGQVMLRDPLGVVILVGNEFYPFNFLIRPLASAMAAGNAVLIQTSLRTPYCASLLADLVPKYLDEHFYKVVIGGDEHLDMMLKHDLDKVMYCGKRERAHEIAAVCAAQLCPVVMQLGGQNPCIVDSNCDMDKACRRILWGRCFNGGQEYDAPNYILCAPEAEPMLIKSFKKIIKEFYGENPKISKDFSRILDEDHFDHLVGLMENGEVAVGGECDRDDLYIAPTILVNIERTTGAELTTEPFLGPILPIIVVNDIDDAIDYVNEREKPYMVYIFSKKKETCRRVMNHTFSGNAMANDVLMVNAISQMPIAGVGESGMGSLHGKYGFDEFSHVKSVSKTSLKKDFLVEGRYPPYNPRKLDSMQKIIDKKYKLKKSKETEVQSKYN